MPQILALEWDGSEVRVVMASSRGDRGVIEQAFAVGLRSTQAPEDPEEEVDVGGQIAAALEARGIGRPETLVAVGRASIELRQLSLPPAPDDELPELVRFQAMREFNQFDEDWLLDFVPLGEANEDEPRSVMAAAIGPELVEQIQQTCASAGLTPQRLILRPCAAASLLGRARSGEPTPRLLLIDLLADEADLTVMIDRKVVFLRTTRLTDDPLENSDQPRALLAEIRRTVAAAENQLGGGRIETIALCGSGQQHVTLAESIQRELSTPTKLFDPFDGLQLGRQLRGNLPENPGRFTPLLGMALAELEQTGHAVDFLHPRRAPEPPTRRKSLIVAGVAAVLLAGSFFGYRGLERKWLNEETRGLTTKKKQLEEEVAAAKKAVKAVEEVKTWTNSDVVWLDELRKLAEDFPPAKKAMLTEMAFRSYPAGGGMMTLKGLAADIDELTQMEDGLRNPSRLVADPGSSIDESSKFYSRRFTLFVRVEPEKQ